MKKIFAVIMATVMGLSMMACSSDDSESADGEDVAVETEIPGEVQTSGNITLFVADGYKLHDGNMVAFVDDEVDPDQCYIQQDDPVPSMYDYYWVKVTTAESAESSVSMTKTVNEGEDLSIDTGNTSWTGCMYVYETFSEELIDCGLIYTTIGDSVVTVTFVGHTPNSDEMNHFLDSISVG